MKRLKYAVGKSTLQSVALALMLLVGASACEKEHSALPTLELNHTDYSFKAEGGTDTLNVVSAGEWTASSNADWLQLSPANGIGKTVCQVKTNPSYSYTDRTATITINTNGATQTITVGQKGFPKQIVLSANQVSVVDQAEPSKMTFDIEVMANVPWKVKYDSEAGYWLTYKADVKSGSAQPVKSVVRFTYDINSIPADRTINVNFEAVNGDVQTAALSISQKAAPVIEPSRRGDSLAISAMVRALRINADLSKRMDYWDGVKLENGRVVELELRFINTTKSLPYEVQYLTELRKLIVATNENQQFKKIKLGSEISKLKKLEVLDLFAYGISELDESIATMTSLRELYLAANTFVELPLNILKKMPWLKAIDFTGNRRVTFIADLSNYVGDKSVTGLHGQIPQELFEMENLEFIALSYNYYEGGIPESKCGMPNLKELKINLNYLTGSIPEWILKHKYLCNWVPYILVFNQEGRDSNGVISGFNNVPEPEEICPITATTTTNK